MIERGSPRCFHKCPNTCEHLRVWCYTFKRLYVQKSYAFYDPFPGPELINERISINPFVFFKHDRRELIGININSCAMGLVPLLVAALLDMTSTTGLVPPVSPYTLGGNLHIYKYRCKGGYTVRVDISHADGIKSLLQANKYGRKAENSLYEGLCSGLPDASIIQVTVVTRKCRGKNDREFPYVLEIAFGFESVGQKFEVYLSNLSMVAFFSFARQIFLY